MPVNRKRRARLRRRGWLCCLLGAGLLSVAGGARAATLQVGPGKAYAKPCAAIMAAKPGDTIEIDAAGDYTGDVCAWATDGLTLRGTGGRAKIDAAGRNSQGKAIWVISGADNTVENIEFSGATVPDHNGAGIRYEGRNLTVRNCYFHSNENGILGGSPGSQLLVEYSEFANNGYGDGYSHNIYTGHADRFTLRFSYSHHANKGHLVKSRAAENYILYNRLSDEATGAASYELDLPNGGRSYVIGNVIHQGPATANGTILAYREEGADPANPGTSLFVVDNTFVNERPAGGTFIFIDSGVSQPAIIRNNVFFGPGTVTTQASAILDSNLTGTDPLFVNAAGYDYHLRAGSRAIDAGADPGIGEGFALTPALQYLHPACGEGRMAAGRIDIGAYEFGAAGFDPSAPARCRWVSAIVNGASFAPGPVAPGSIVSVFGANMASSTAQASGLPLPVSLGDVSVSINGIAAPLFYASPSQLNVQVPYEVPPPPLGPALPILLVSIGGGSYWALPLPVQPTAPAVFLVGNRAAALNQDLTLNGDKNPAAAGSVISVFLTGQGAVVPAVATGRGAPASPLSPATAPFSATIGGKNAEVLFLGLAPGFAGLAQANIRVPALPAGDHPLIVTIGGVSSNPALIAVSAPPAP